MLRRSVPISFQLEPNENKVRESLGVAAANKAGTEE